MSPKGETRSRNRWLLVVALAGVAGLVLSANAATSAGAGTRFPDRGYSPTGGIQLQTIHRFGETFFQAGLAHFDHNGTGTIVLAGNADGSGTTLVDDVIVIKVTHENGSTSTFRHDYSHACTGSVAMGPVDITNLFEVGSNQVLVTLKDNCGGEDGSNAIWITGLQ